MKKYWTVAALGWQDSLVYRFNALLWVAYAVLPSLTLMLVWLAAYEGKTKIGNYTLSEMLTYYLFVTGLSVVITPHPEWDLAMSIRDGKITPFLLKPVNYFFYRLSWETAYQTIKTAMMLPAFGLLWWAFRAYIDLPPFDLIRLVLFVLSALGAYLILTQLKFLLGISAFWIAEPGGFMEIWNVLNGLFAGRLLPVTLLPIWAQWVGIILPFAILYSFPMEILLARIGPQEIVWGFARQILWLGILTWVVQKSWSRGLLAYEAYGG